MASHGYNVGMARPLRIEFDGALYHITSRGNEGRAIFRDVRDHDRRLEWLARTVRTYGWVVHAFVHMTNHDHLFIETPRGNLSAGMQYLNGCYTGYFNARHRRAGHLFQGRFKAILIETEGHYLEVSRYVHLNPVRAGLTDKPQDWLWTSYRGYHRLKHTLAWVTYSRVLAEFDHRDDLAARKAYRRFVRAGMDEGDDSPDERAVYGLILGSEEFVDRISRRLKHRKLDRAVPTARSLRQRPSLDSIVQAVQDMLHLDPTDWLQVRRCNHLARPLAAYLARRRFGYRATEVAAVLGYAGPSSVCVAINRIDPHSKSLAARLKTIERKLLNE